jgi:uncharacterized membrane protein (UPF0127 family)
MEVAITPQERAHGLAGREQCGKGMLFIFGETAFHPMWMRGMKFPLDIVWLRSFDGSGSVVVDWARCAAPEPILRFPSFWPSYGQVHVASNAVLELPVGSITEHRLAINSTVDIVGIA